MVPLFPYPVVRHGDVPTTVVNGRGKIVGSVGEDEFIARIVAGG